jgi:Tol biopolymer transport system component
LISGDNLQAGFLQGQLKVLGLEDPTQGYTTEEENAMAFFWSPDSKKVAYFPYQVLTVKLTPEQGGSEGSERATPYQTVRLKVLDLDKDGETREVTYPFPPTDLFMSVLALFTQYQQSASIWSPDSQNLVLSAHLPDGSPVIWVVRASGRLEPRYLVNGVLAFWSRR